ncbi:ExbD/TolR family protein [Endozoicomonas lisbonensis]|uniref:Biopolymer transport protein ExbD n=1 Tax=Endozoicomonas lisbonensis TaxID=3120522 RepID=A0ABV2SJW3_9GAMM
MIDIPEPEKNVSVQDAMTPMIDVIFSLIAFMMLMINAPMLNMQVELPETESAVASTTPLEKEVITITINPEVEGWFLNEQKIDSDEQLKTELVRLTTEYDESFSIVVSSDKDASVQAMVNLFAILQSLKLEVAHLALQSGGKPS